MNRVAQRSTNGLSIVALVWVGLLLGVSFVATPAKFLAPSLTLPVALDVGRYTFGIFSMVEVIATIVLLACAVLSRCGRPVVFIGLLVGGFVAVQSLWLLPVLDARVEIILQGGRPENSGLHSLYIALEAGKVVLLSFIGWWSFHIRRQDYGSNGIL